MPVFEPIDISHEDLEFIEAAKLWVEAFNEYKEFTDVEDFILEASKVKESGSKDDRGRQLQAQEERNAQASEKADNAFKKLWDSVMKMLKKLMDGIHEFIERRKMSKEEREAFDAFKEACKKDPSLKNQKITTMDFKKVDAEYNALVKKIDEEYAQAEKGKVRPFDKLTEEVENFAKKTGKGAFTTINAASLINLAGVDSKIANKIYDNLHRDENRLQQLKDSMGDKQYKKFEKQLNSLKREIEFGPEGHRKRIQCVSLTRLKLKLTHRYYEDYISAYTSAYRDVYDIAKGKIISGSSTGTHKKLSGTQKELRKGLVKDNKYTSKLAKDTLTMAGAIGGERAKEKVRSNFPIEGSRIEGFHPIKKRIRARERKKAQAANEAIGKKWGLGKGHRPSFQPKGGDSYRD